MKKLILILVLFLAGCVCISKKEYKELLEASQSIIILPSVYPTQAELRQEARDREIK